MPIKSIETDVYDKNKYIISLGFALYAAGFVYSLIKGHSHGLYNLVPCIATILLAIGYFFQPFSLLHSEKLSIPYLFAGHVILAIYMGAIVIISHLYESAVLFDNISNIISIFSNLLLAAVNPLYPLGLLLCVIVFFLNSTLYASFKTPIHILHAIASVFICVGFIITTYKYYIK
jgi:hypothetical protein